MKMKGIDCPLYHSLLSLIIKFSATFRLIQDSNASVEVARLSLKENMRTITTWKQSVAPVRITTEMLSLRCAPRLGAQISSII